MTAWTTTFNPLAAAGLDRRVGLLIASGLVEGDARFRSVAAKTLYSRCHKAFKPFSEVDAGKITHARNEYLHGSAAGFTAIPPASWWPRYWAQAVILVNALERDIEDLVGSDRVATVEESLAQNKKNIEHRTEMLVDQAKRRLAQYESGTLPAKIAAEWSPGRSGGAGLRYSASEACPACGTDGTLEGDEVEDSNLVVERVSEEDYDTRVDLTVFSDYFSCDRCGLILDNYATVEQAGLSTTFDAEGSEYDIAMYEGDYGND